MVITTHMYNQMIQDQQRKLKEDKGLSNPDSAEIKSFLKNATDLEKTEKVISSNS